MHVLAAVLVLASPYRVQAAHICRHEGLAEAAVAARLGTHPTRAQALAVWPQLLALGRKSVRELRALHPPASLRADHHAAVDARSAQFDVFAAALAAVRNGETPAQAAAGTKSRLIGLVAAERAAWRRAGIGACAVYG